MNQPETLYDIGNEPTPNGSTYIINPDDEANPDSERGEISLGEALGFADIEFVEVRVTPEDPQASSEYVVIDQIRLNVPESSSD